MTENEWLAEKFQEKRPHLRAVAYRILGSNGEADDAVQEAWLRLARSDAEEHGKSRRLAHDRGGQGLPGHASVAQIQKRSIA